jgi:hypothetical protein
MWRAASGDLLTILHARDGVFVSFERTLAVLAVVFAAAAAKLARPQRKQRKR